MSDQQSAPPVQDEIRSLLAKAEKHLEALWAEFPLWRQAQLMRKGLGLDPVIGPMRQAADLVDAHAGRLQALEAALKVARAELWRTYGESPRVDALFDMIDAALSASSAGDKGK